MSSNQYAIRVEDETVFVSGEDGAVEVGELSDVYDLVGGETYTIEYGENAAQMPWLDTAADGTLTFDVREALAGMGVGGEFAEALAETPLDPGDDGVPRRTALFADLVTHIWDEKGEIDAADADGR